MENTMMMNRKELSLNDLENVHGGWDWDKIAAGCFGGGTIAAAAASMTIICISNPVGWIAGAAFLGATAAGAVAGGGIGALVGELTD